MINNDYEYDMQLSKSLQEDYTKSESDKIHDSLIEKIEDLKDDALFFGFGVNNENK